MTLRVPGIPPQLLEGTGATSENQIRAALPVLGYGQWYNMAVAANWLGGIGGALAFYSGPRYADPGDTETLRFYCWPRSQHSTWVWLCSLASYSGDGTNRGSFGTATVTPGGDEFTWSVDAGDTPQVFAFVHNPSSVATGEATIAFATDSDATDSLHIMSIGLYEVPRVFLDSAGGSIGVHETSCVRYAPIYENTGTADKYSVQAVFEQVRDAATTCRRNVLVSWFNPDGVTATTTVFSGTSNIFRIDPAAQTRLLYPGNTTGIVQWAVYAAAASGSVGQVRVTTTLSATSTITITNTVAAWVTGTFTIECDDMTESDLVRGGSRDTMRFEARRVSGTSVTVYGLAVGED